jgi:hypothetical protein
MPEDRDQLFEKALARHLRTQGADESLCLDPETLAAYHERMLSPEELSSAKSHIVSCSRCQEILAHLEATQEINELQHLSENVAPVSVVRVATPPEKVVAIAAKKFSSLRWAAPAGAIAAALLIWIGVRDSSMLRKPSSEATTQISENHQQAPLPSAAEESKAFGLPKEKEAERRKSDAFSADRLNERASIPRAIPTPQPSLLDEDKDSAVAGKLEAENNKPSTRHEYSARTGAGMGGGRGPSAAAAQGAQANNALQRGDQGVVGGAAKMVDAVPAPPDLDKAEAQKTQAPLAAKSAVVAAARPGVPPPPPPTPKRPPGRLRGTVTDPSGAAVAGANVQLQSDSGRTLASTSTDASGTYFFSGVAEGNYQLQLQSAGFRTDILTGLNIQAGENVMNAKLEIGSATETVQVAAQAPVMNSTSVQVAEVTETHDLQLQGRDFQTLVLLSPGLQTVASPDGKAVWKFGEAGQIFHSTNAGKEWTSQVSGVTVKLLVGSAPSAKVCWVVGASGTLLRTTDGGKHWQRISVPVNGDLGGVHASDDKHASIWDTPNRVSYETTDGGKTWKQTANE